MVLSKKYMEVKTVSKKILAFILAACMTLSMTACGGSDSSDAETQSSSFSESESSESDDTSSDESSNESSEVDSEDESSKETPKKIEDSSSEDDNSSKETTTKKTETPKTTKATQPVVTQAPVTQKPATTTKTTNKTTTHTHRWVKQWDDGNGTIFYWCPDCFAEKYDHYTVTTTTTKTQPTSKTIKSNEWIPVYNKTVVANCVDSGGYDKVTGKRVHFISPTYWDVKALSRGEAKAQADYKKANDEASEWCDPDNVKCSHWVQGGNDHPINTPDKSSIAFWYYRDSNGKLAIQFPMSPNQRYSGIKTEADLKTYGCYDSVSLIGTPGLGYDVVYYTGTPWAK